MSVNFRSFVGAAGRSLVYRRSDFFQPYKSKTDFALRATSIITAPILFPACAIVTFILGVGELIGALQTGGSLKDGGKYLLASFLFLLTAPLSPLANAIDALGSALVTPVFERHNNALAAPGL